MVTIVLSNTFKSVPRGTSAYTLAWWPSLTSSNLCENLNFGASQIHSNLVQKPWNLESELIFVKHIQIRSKMYKFLWSPAKFTFVGTLFSLFWFQSFPYLFVSRGSLANMIPSEGLSATFSSLNHTKIERFLQELSFNSSFFIFAFVLINFLTGAATYRSAPQQRIWLATLNLVKVAFSHKNHIPQTSSDQSIIFS